MIRRHLKNKSSPQREMSHVSKTLSYYYIIITDALCINHVYNVIYFFCSLLRNRDIVVSCFFAWLICVFSMDYSPEKFHDVFS